MNLPPLMYDPEVVNMDSLQDIAAGNCPSCVTAQWGPASVQNLITVRCPQEGEERMSIDIARVHAALRANFECVDDWPADPELGLKMEEFSGLFIRTIDLDAWVARVKTVLPPDAKIMSFDGVPIRMGDSDDMYFIVFGSKTWPKVTGGYRFPRLEVWVARKADSDHIPEMNIGHVPWLIEHHLYIDKRFQTVTIPKDQETEDRCMVLVTPKYKTEEELAQELERRALEERKA